MLVIVAQDASANTKKLFYDKCTFYQVPVRQYGEKSVLGRAIGKEERSSLAVCDAGLAKAVTGQLEQDVVCEAKWR
jgi:ribosomal protein L7Ae-like RNA K-turn-binding protein